MSPAVSLRHPVPSVTEPIAEEEEEPEEANYESNTDESSLGSLPSAPPPETPRAVALTPTNEIPGAVPRPRKNSQHPDPYGTFSRRSSAIFGGAHSPHASINNTLTHFPILDDGDDEVTIPVRSRLSSMIDGSQYRHLRTLSTVSIHESAARPGGLAAIAPIGKFVGAKTGGADAPPSTPPTELQRD
jgi:mitogen-activated protein kinase 7